MLSAFFGGIAFGAGILVADRRDYDLLGSLLFLVGFISLFYLLRVCKRE